MNIISGQHGSWTQTHSIQFPTYLWSKTGYKTFSHPGNRNQINSKITWQIDWELRTFSQTNTNFPFMFRQPVSVKLNRLKKQDIKVEGRLLGERVVVGRWGDGGLLGEGFSGKKERQYG